MGWLLLLMIQLSYIVLVEGIVQATDSIMSDSSFNPDSSVGSAGFPIVVLPHSVDYDTNPYANDNN